MKQRSVGIWVLALYGLVMLGSMSVWAHSPDANNKPTTMQLLVQSLSREVASLQQHVSSLKQLVEQQQLNHKRTAAEQQKTIEQLLARIQKLESGVAGAAAPSPVKVAPSAPTPEKTAPSADVVGDAPSFGPADAKVTIVEYSDFQCPFCARGAKTVKQLMKDYEGKIRVVFRHFPLSFHADAHLAAQAAMAAHEQGKFWDYHDKLFDNMRNLKKPDLLRYAKELGLDVQKFHDALDSGKFKGYVDNDLKAASAAGANGTPTFIINGNKVVGAQPIDNFKRVIDAILAGKPVPSNEPPARRPQPSGPVKINMQGAPAKGSDNAKITMVVFSDFQCSFCSRGAKIMGDISKAYGDKVKFVFKHLPLPFHNDAHLAAQAAMAAHEQGKFWDYHDKLFANMQNLKKDDLVRYAQELKLDLANFKAALDGGKYKQYVDNDLSEAGRVGAEGTPTFFLNGHRVVGAQPFSNFKNVIDQILAGKQPSGGDNGDGGDRPAPPSGPVKLNIQGAPSMGAADAKVTIVAFSDFQCPFCSRGADSMREVAKKYGNSVKIVFKHLPLSFHTDAHLAAQASMAAHEQGKFWEYHDKLFANMQNLKKDDLVRYAQELKLDVAKFKAALDGGKFKKYVDNDLAEAGTAGADGTPTFFVNGKRIVGAVPFSNFQTEIDGILKK